MAKFLRDWDVIKVFNFQLNVFQKNILNHLEFATAYTKVLFDLWFIKIQSDLPYHLLIGVKVFIFSQTYANLQLMVISIEGKLRYVSFQVRAKRC